MLKIWRINGNSMSPEIQEGDFVVIYHIPFLKRFNLGDRIIFRHPIYGVLIKTIKQIDWENKLFWVAGESPHSLNSQKIGPIEAKQIFGKVIWHIHPN